ncbi:cell division protein FtsX [Clostridium baratii]|uniref:Cell division protein FtsX n=3 Tax=Clostridium TaxID=1485 RepID=A0A0A7G071_9CLOT|nr:permease-like cell division protein FtsX [Clostridium baratii]AIY84580.1 ftsX-like permease family protein [Clostridium baratii str. Sullivan]AQM59066.1 ABC transporter permease [Clostridium baratii]KJU72369.1 cell division protein FtsX [Clostridium baratii]MBS6007009.1 permease-like cell division protein FtsX [Clostridium baratii]MBS6042199.1 permease-like cell division protein FtsX [Clostridium baratii]
MKINTVNHFISDAFKSLRRNKTICFASIITVIITFFVLGIFVLITKNVGLALNDVQSKVELKVFLKDDIKLIEQREVEIKLHELPGVKDVQYESKEQAFTSFQESTKDNKGLLEGYSLEKNPFPASFIVKLADPSDAEAVTNAVKDLPGVESIGNQQDLINTITKVVNGIKVVGAVLFIILVGVAIFLIMNTTKLTVYSRRREVGIMKFVGATDWFIRWPFIIEGMIIGLIGSVISTFFVFLVYKGFVSWISSKVLYVSLINVSYIGTALLWEFALGGLIVGGVASYAALRKFLIV